jgi:hypothetical protein
MQSETITIVDIKAATVPRRGFRRRSLLIASVDGG